MARSKGASASKKAAIKESGKPTEKGKSIGLKVALMNSSEEESAKKKGKFPAKKHAKGKKEKKK